MDAHRLDDEGQHHIQKARHHDAAAGVLQLFTGLHGRVHAAVHGAHGGEAAQEGEGGAQESGHLHLRAEVEEQGAEAGEEQRGLDGQRQAVALDQDGHQHGGAEHGEHVLQTQDQHFGHPQGAGVPDGLLTDIRFLFIHISFFSSLLLHTGAKKIPALQPAQKMEIP